jgi:hypothetical protein
MVKFELYIIPAKYIMMLTATIIDSLESRIVIDRNFGPK